MIKILLTGFMAAGKTTMGSEIAARYGLEFFDTDSIIEKRAQKSIARIFADSGEDFFRQLESESFAQLLVERKNSSFIVSTGGGLILQAKNRELVAKVIVVFLDTDFCSIYGRLQRDIQKRPLILGLNETEIEKLFLQRRKKYLEYADHVVKNVDELDKLIKKLNEQVKADDT